MTDHIVNYLVESVGMRNYILLEETIIWVSGLLMGVLLLIWYFVYFGPLVKVDKSLPEGTILKVKHKGCRTWIVTNFSTNAEALKVVLALIVPIKGDHYNKRDNIRAKIIYGTFVSLTFLILISTLLLVWNELPIYLHPNPHP